MGKGEIESGGTDGRYNVLIKYKRDSLEAEIRSLDERISTLETSIAAMPEGIEKSIANLEKTALETRKEYLKINMPNDFIDDVWCVDFTEDLSGEVGTIEVLGEIGGNEEIVLQPGFQGKATYDAKRDGQVLPGVVATPEQFFYNLAMLPGWQKWRPLYRFATITSVDKQNDTATISLEDAHSSQQYIDINTVSTIENVPIEYMDCNAAVFEEGDHVLVKFEGQSWDKPKIIGFRKKPKPCVTGLILFCTHCSDWRDPNPKYFIWNSKKNQIEVYIGTSTDLKNAGYKITDYSNWGVPSEINNRPVKAKSSLLNLMGCGTKSASGTYTWYTCHDTHNDDRKYPGDCGYTDYRECSGEKSELWTLSSGESVLYPDGEAVNLTCSMYLVRERREGPTINAWYYLLPWCCRPHDASQPYCCTEIEEYLLEYSYKRIGFINSDCYCFAKKFIALHNEDYVSSFIPEINITENEDYFDQHFCLGGGSPAAGCEDLHEAEGNLSALYKFLFPLGATHEFTIACPSSSYVLPMGYLPHDDSYYEKYRYQTFFKDFLDRTICYHADNERCILQIYVVEYVLHERHFDPEEEIYTDEHSFKSKEIVVSSHAKYLENEPLSEYNPFAETNNETLSGYIKALIEAVYFRRDEEETISPKISIIPMFL